MTVPIRPVIGLAAQPNQYFGTNLMSAAQAALGCPMDMFRYSTAINDPDNTNPTYINPILANGWTLYIDLALNVSGILAAVAAGNYDAAITSMATSAIGQPSVVRYFAEANAVGSNDWSGDPTDFIAAFRHCHTLWRNAGNNSPFMFCVNQNYNPPTTDFTSYYPGDDVVDIMAIDAYPAYNSPPTYADLAASDIATLISLSPSKPVHIGEVGVKAYINNRAPYIASVFEYLITQPSIVGLTYWMRDQDNIMGNSDALAAFAEGRANWIDSWGAAP